MKGKQLAHINLRLTAIALMAVLLAVFAQASSPASQEANCVPTLAPSACTQPAKQYTLTATASERNMYARPADAVRAPLHGQVTRPGRDHARLGIRMGGGCPSAGLAHARLGRCRSILIHSPFTLASSGVAFITSRACDYYIFALRRILD